MNRLAVYSYLTRYPYGILGLADCSQYLCQKRAKNGYCAKLSVKMRCRTRQELTDNYEILVLLVYRTFFRQLYYKSAKTSIIHGLCLKHSLECRLFDSQCYNDDRSGHCILGTLKPWSTFPYAFDSYKPFELWIGTISTKIGWVDYLKMHQDKAELVNNKGTFLEFSCLHPLYKSRKADKHGSQASRQAGRTAFPRSDVGLETARVR